MRQALRATALSIDVANRASLPPARRIERKICWSHRRWNCQLSRRRTRINRILRRGARPRLRTILCAALIASSVANLAALSGLSFTANGPAASSNAAARPFLGRRSVRCERDASQGCERDLGSIKIKSEGMRHAERHSWKLHTCAALPAVRVIGAGSKSYATP